MCAHLGRLVLERHQRRTLDDRNVVAGEFVARQKLAHLELDQFEQLRIVDHVDLVQVHDQRGDADLAGQQDVLAGLRHRAVRGRDDEDRAVHLRGAGDHVLHIVGVAGAVDVGVVALLGLVLDMRGRDRDAASLFLRRLVDLVIGGVSRAARLGQNLGDRSRQRRLAVVDMADRANVAMGLVTRKLFLGHSRTPFRGPSFSTRFRRAHLNFSMISAAMFARDLLIMVELHGEVGSALRAGAQLVDVTEHVGQRHHGVDDHGVGAHVLTLHVPAPRQEIAHHEPRVLLRSHHFHFHDRLEQDRAALLQAFTESRAGGDLERQRR